MEPLSHHAPLDRRGFLRLAGLTRGEEPHAERICGQFTREIQGALGAREGAQYDDITYVIARVPSSAQKGKVFLRKLG